MQSKSQVCPNCSSENPADAKFCQQCGQPLALLCHNCSTSNDSNAKFCKNCGFELRAAVDNNQETRLSSLQQSAPSSFREKMRAATTALEGERKHVSILFVDIVGSTSIAEKLDPEEWKEVVTGVHRRVGEAIYRYEGTIAQLLGDGVLAFFGAPVTHEDDPVRAVRAGLDLLESIQSYREELTGYIEDFHVRVGINTGTVVIGNIGSDMHMEYTALGDVVNVASRIESSAYAGTVLVSEETFRLATDQIEFKDYREISAKGKREAVKVFEVIGLRNSLVGQTPVIESSFVGREKELAVMQDVLLSLSSGRGQVVVVLGEAGIGKSRFMREARAHSARNYNMRQAEIDSESLLVPPSGLRWLVGRSVSYGESLSFRVITQLLLADLSLPEGTPEARVEIALRKRVKELFNSDGGDILPLLTNLLGLKLGSKARELIQSASGETLRRRTLDAIAAYFSAVAEEQPIALVFEDMHWADPSSMQTLEKLIELTDRLPLLILCVMRIEKEHRSWKIKLLAETDYAHRYMEIQLLSLTQGESAALVDGLWGYSELPQDIQKLVMMKSEGNPLYIEEVSHHLVELGVLVKSNGKWEAAEKISEIGIPETLQGVLLARIDRLEKDVRQTLQLASVIGRSFLYKVLHAISASEEQLDAHLTQLQRSDLVRENTRLPELEYIFKHALTQEAAYNSLLIERRTEFHRLVGQALENLFPEQADEFTGLLAHHWDRAGDVKKASKYLTLAGERARRLHAHHEALVHFDRAIELSDKGTHEYIALLRKRAQVYVDLFQGKPAVADFDEINSFAHAEDNHTIELEALLGLGRAYYIVALDEPGADVPENSRKNYELAYDLAKSLDDKAGMVKALLPTIYLADFWPDYEDQVEANMKEAAELSLSIDDDDLALENELAQFQIAPTTQKIELFSGLRSKLETKQDLTRLNMVHFFMMWAYLEQGLFERAVETCDSGIALAKRIGVPPVQYPTLKGWALMRLGRFDQAFGSFQQEVSDEDHRFGRVFRDFGYAITYLQLLDHDQARIMLEVVLKEAQLLNRAWLISRANAYIIPAMLGGRNSEPQVPNDILDQLEEGNLPKASIASGAYLLSKGKHKEALEKADAAYALATEYTHQPDKVNAILLKARVLTQIGDHGKSLAAAQEGIRIATEIEYVPLLWQLHAIKAETHSALGDATEASHSNKQAGEVIQQLADTISDEQLKAGFLGHPRISSILGAIGNP
ncbi:MAG: AAA family ATPase [Chloroflexi bacterium]|nr:AAA family ATPase [Chloroflexota bacterium]